MGRVVVLANRSLADGFRLAGVETRDVAPGESLRAQLHGVVTDPDVALVIVTDDLWTSLDERARARVEYLPQPLVMSVPAGAVSDVSARRQLLGEMLERAIGYRVELPRTVAR